MAHRELIQTDFPSLHQPRPVEDYETKHARLKREFDRVANPANWKLPINRLIVPHLTNDECAEILDAVIFFTGSVPTFTHTKKGIRVRAVGYYNAIGA